MASTFSEVHTLAAGVNAITLGQGGNVPGSPVVPFGVPSTNGGMLTHGYIKVVKHVETFNAPAELWVDVAGGTAARDVAGIESVPELAAESNLIVMSGHETRSRVTTTGELAISIWSSGAGDVTIEAVH